MYHPFIININSNKNEINNKTDNIVLSPRISYPLFALGFHSYLHRTRSAMEITKNLQTKEKFYYVVNPFEPNISNYEDDITSLTKKYFKYNKDIPHEFLNIWEILFALDIINKNKIDVLILSDGISDVLDLYKDKLDANLNIIANEKNIKKKNSFDLIVSSQNIIVDDENFIEQHFYKELLTTIVKILKNQSDNGNSVIKIYDTMTIVSLKIINLISSFYDDTFIYKPFISRESDSEKYLILKKFKAPKNADNLIKILEDIIKLIDNKNKDFTSDIFPEMVLSKEFMGIFKFINIRLINNQQIMINEIIKYIKENNYFGDKYHIFRDKQIESTKWWISTFYPPSKNLYEKNQTDISKLYKTTLDKTNLECKKFLETLI
jgi:23S rRNA U2552 (ribose-2'-O)-methylase RlmE/FtsJ